MVSKIRFRIIESESTFLHPQKEFRQVTEKFQVRRDPLTGRTCHFSHFGAIQPPKLPLDSYERPEIKGFCPFCPENRDRFTPRFVESVVSEEATRRNQAHLIPNLFPYDVHSGIVIMTDAHVVPLDLFSEEQLIDAFSLGFSFLRRIKTVDASLPYHLMTWNYMPPSGGGLVHPHQQFFASEYPGNLFMDEIKASEEFWRIQRTNYWSELIHEEKRIGKRFLGVVGSSSWLTSFVSLGMLGDVLAIFPDVFSLEDLGDAEIRDLVSGLRKVFSYYSSRNIQSFNASLVFGPQGQHHFSSHFRIIPRTFLNVRDYAPDFNFFQALLGEPVGVVLPEEIAQEMRAHF
jgi:UDPglucose--hexose-1-phosphate uridylyltransferase